MKIIYMNQNKAEARDMSGATKKNNTETSNKRPRNETASTLPAFKVKRDELFDEIFLLELKLW